LIFPAATRRDASPERIDTAGRKTLMNSIQLGVQLMGYGLLGVFTVLLIFMGAIKLLTIVFPEKEKDIPKA
jgi:hypothetical protein